MVEARDNPMLTFAACLTDQRGRVTVVRGAQPSAELARASLMMNRQEVRFIHRDHAARMSVRLERSGTRIRGAEDTTVRIWPASLSNDGDGLGPGRATTGRPA